MGGEPVADRGDPEHDRFKAMYAQHYPAVLRYAARRVGAEAARDIAAETFLTAWRRLDRVPPEQSLPWLYATARRCLANELRRQDRRERMNSRVRDEAARGQDVAGQELSERVAERLAVVAALAALRPDDQEVLRLIEWERLDVAAAAQVMGCSAATFRVRLHRARRRFARALGQADESGGRDPDAVPRRPHSLPERRSGHEISSGRRLVVTREQSGAR
jgi:RNA polymerase sigma-70 factor (ECF subfamily)